METEAEAKPTAFTFLEKYWRAVETLEKPRRDALLLAIVYYGVMHDEPEFGEDMELMRLFEAFRDDLDYSRTRHETGNKGGRPRKARS